MKINLHEYSQMLEEYVYYFGNARMRSEARTLRYCMYINYRETKKITIELINEGLLPSMKEMEKALREEVS